MASNKPNKTLDRRIRLFGMLFQAYFGPAFIFAMKRKKVTAKRFLIIPQLTRIGDVICSTPVFAAIKKARPDAHVAVLVSAMISPLLQANIHVDEVIVFEEYSTRELIGKIRKEHFDVSVSLSGTSESTLFALLGRVPQRIKLFRQERPITELLTDWIATGGNQYKDHVYLPAFYLKLLEQVGIYEYATKKEVYVIAKGEEKAGNFIRDNLLENKLCIGICITAGNPIKEWGDDKFLELARKLVREKNAKVVFIGSSGDEKRIDTLIKKAEPVIVTSLFKATSFSLEELPSILKHMTLFISGDTGPVHIAHALGVPLVDIIGPVHPSEQAPQDEKSIVVLPEPAVEASIFAFDKPGPAELSRKSLNQISVDRVYDVVEKLNNK